MRFSKFQFSNPLPLMGGAGFAVSGVVPRDDSGGLGLGSDCGKEENLMQGSPFKATQKVVYKNTVEKMAQAMKEKKFDWGGMDDPIMVDAKGNIVQGHHRVVAARLSKTKIPESAIHKLPGEPVRDARPWGNVTLKPGEKPQH